MVYLNTVEEGGETRFYRGSSWFSEPWASVRPEPGLGLFFKHRLLHEGAEVLRGVKYALRTDVMYGP